MKQTDSDFQKLIYDDSGYELFKESGSNYLKFIQTTLDLKEIPINADECLKAFKPFEITTKSKDYQAMIDYNLLDFPNYFSLFATHLLTLICLEDGIDVNDITAVMSYPYFKSIEGKEVSPEDRLAALLHFGVNEKYSDLLLICLDAIDAIQHLLVATCQIYDFPYEKLFSKFYEVKLPSTNLFISWK